MAPLRNSGTCDEARVITRPSTASSQALALLRILGEIPSPGLLEGCQQVYLYASLQACYEQCKHLTRYQRVAIAIDTYIIRRYIEGV
jgi:hypothetical protein